MQLEATAPDAAFARLQQSRAYDLLMRLPLLGWSLLCATVQIAGLSQYLHAAQSARFDAVFAIHIAMRLSTLGFLMLLAATVLLRARPQDKAQGVEPRISALIGSFLIYAIPFFPRCDLPLTAGLVSTVLVLFGSVAAIVALAQLGRSFSIMAEARRLVTSGPYRWVRHPLYLAEELAIIGLALQFASLWTALLLAGQIAFQLRRMHNEEAVLARTFSQYAEYRARTARLIPGIY
jgi:protein-S-isoprenylcysteine O-methyltransferase Ste14